jgi:putative SOS response-associated peptidase YedK
MCSQFTQRFGPGELISVIKLIKELGIFAEPKANVLPRQNALVVASHDGLIQVDEMQFALLPRWSKESTVKYATHNARLDTIEEKASFKDAFIKRHCVVPMSGFVEPIYEGDLAGNMVEFNPCSTHVLLAAGIWEEWSSKETGEIIQSFSVITHEPIPFVRKTGHDRSPLLLSKEGTEQWLASEGSEAKELKESLLNHQDLPELSAKIYRPMRPGWQKRRKA